VPLRVRIRLLNADGAIPFPVGRENRGRFAVSGYSGTPLARKLGIKPSTRVRVIDPPERFYDLLESLPDDVDVDESPAGRAAVTVLFVTREDDLQSWLTRLEPSVERGDRLWIAWPKKASRRPTDLSFPVVQGEGLARDLVDTKVCAIDDVWSGLCFMRRRAARAAT
jgi:hypothetical protein